MPSEKYLGPLARAKNAISKNSKEDRKKWIQKSSASRKVDLREYTKLRRTFLAKNTQCACHKILNCGVKAIDVHHIRGRSGALLNLTDFWLPVCRNAHDWIHDNIPAARGHQWIAKEGEWNVVP